MSNTPSRRPPPSPSPLSGSAAPGSPVVTPIALSPSGSSSSSSATSRPTPAIADLLSTPPPISVTTFATASSTITAASAGRRRGSSISQASDDGTAVTFVNPNRDWQDIALSELVQKDKLILVDADTSVEKAFEIMNSQGFTSIPIRDGVTVNHTFDYADLNAYLLLVLGHIEPIDNSTEVETHVVNARAGKEVPVRFVSQLGIKDPYVVMPATSTLVSAVEILGTGVHRFAVSDPSNPSDIIGIVSQRRLIRYIWENGRSFKSLEGLFQKQIGDLKIGSTQVLSINGEEPVIKALQLMHNEGVSSLAVVDSNKNLLGNISIVDVRLLTKYSQSPLLRHSCKQFLNVILSSRGLADGKDSFPVFYVTMESTLGRTIAKLVATNAHRLWIVQSSTSSASPSDGHDGQLVGVVSLTDIIHLFAKHAGKEFLDPNSARHQRRRSSSSSVRTQPSIEAFRRSSSIGRTSIDRT